MSRFDPLSVIADYTGGLVKVVELGMIVHTKFMACSFCSFDTVKENLVYANSSVNSNRRVEVETLSEDLLKVQPFVPQDWKVNYEFKSDRQQIGGFNNISAELDEHAMTANEYKAGIQSGRDYIQAQLMKIGAPDEKKGAPAEDVIYNFNGYDFNEIITDDQYTKTPDYMKDQKGIENWLLGKNSVLANRGVGEITTNATNILVDGGDDRNGELPGSGTILIDNEEINYSTKTVDTYKPALVVTNRGANGTVAQDHNKGNANTPVLLKTIITGINDNESTIVLNTAGGAKATNGLIRIGNQLYPYVNKSGSNIIMSSSCGDCHSISSKISIGVPVYIEIGRAGTLVSRIIDYETKKDAKETVSVAVILTHLQKEYSLIKNSVASDSALSHAMGCGNPSDLLRQLLCGIDTSRNKFYELDQNYGLEITSCKVRKNQRIYYTEPDGSVNGPKLTNEQRDAQKRGVAKWPIEGTKHAVKLRIMNKATKALYGYTPHVTHWNISIGGASGGNSGFAKAWRDLGFGQ